MPDNNIYTHSHRHTHSHRLGHPDPVVDAYPHTHDDAGGRNDSHPHRHRADEPHTHLGDALGLPEYWRRRARWWAARLAAWFDRHIGQSNNHKHRMGANLQTDQEVACRTCRSMGMMGMGMMFGIPASCPACRIRRNE